MNKLKGILLGIFVLLSLTAHASRSISEDRARELAAAHLQSYGKELVENAHNESDNRETYVFPIKGKGFVVVSARDVFRNPVLFYCTNYSYRDKDMPDYIRSMVDNLPQFVSNYKSTSLRSGSDQEDEELKDKKPQIPPLIKTQWTQCKPYNSLLDGAVTGCVATAVAQILYHYRYPETCAGVPAYIAEGVKYDALESTTFDYDKMQTSYGEDESADEVAKLMKYCGHALKTVYGGKESTAYYEYVIPALTKIFGYSVDVEILDANYFYFNDWYDAIDKELLNGRPVIVMGDEIGDNGKKEGHCYICDGYENFSYHFNMCYGEFTENEEFFNAFSRYNLDKLAIVGIQKPTTRKFEGGELEFSQFKLHSTYCVNEASILDFFVRNAGDETYKGQFYLSKTGAINSVQPTMIDGVLNISLNELSIEPGQITKLTYSIGHADTGNVHVELTTREGEKIKEMDYHVGGYTSSNEYVDCIVEFPNYSYYDNEEGVFYLNSGWNDVNISFENYGDIDYRGVVHCFVTNSHMDVDTLSYNGDWVIEVPAGKHTYPVKHSIWVPNTTLPNLFQIGVSPRFLSVPVCAKFMLTKRTLYGVERMAENDNSVTWDALQLYLDKYHPDSVFTKDANPNCLYMTDREGYKPYGVTHNLVVNGASDSIVIMAEHPFLSDEEIKATVAEFYKDFDPDILEREPVTLRSVSDDEYNWACMIFPFSPDSAYLKDGTEILHSDKIKVYSFNEHLEVVPCQTIQPNVPYLIGVKGTGVRFRAWDVVVPASRSVEQKTDFGSLVSSSVPYSSMDQFSYSSSYTFDPKSRSFERDILSMFDDSDPFTVTLMNDDFLGEDSYQIDMTTGLSNIVSDSQDKVILYTPLGVSQGEYRIQNGEIDGLERKGVYISKGRKFLKK